MLVRWISISKNFSDIAWSYGFNEGKFVYGSGTTAACVRAVFAY